VALTIHITHYGPQEGGIKIYKRGISWYKESGTHYTHFPLLSPVWLSIITWLSLSRVHTLSATWRHTQGSSRVEYREQSPVTRNKIKLVMSNKPRFFEIPSFH
jgi:hypothetical protein